jgi:long-subunit acyl-CoA synthetase (AMP-forming)
VTAGAGGVAAMFAAAARDYPGRTFLRWCRGDARVVWSYAEAAVRIDALVARLDSLGIAAGEHVVVHTAEMVPSILFDLACACAGVIFAPLETSSVPAVLELCARTGARAVLTTPERAGACAYGDVPVIAEDGRGAAPAGDPAGDPAAAIARLVARAGRVDREATYMLQPTSGTTGGSKLVLRPHAAFVRVARLLALGADRASEPPARFLMVAALTHGMGQYLMTAAMSLAAELAVTSRLDVGTDLEEIRTLDPTVLGLTPRVMRRMVQQLGGVPEGSGRIFGPSARIMITGGAPPDPDIMLAFERSGVHVVEAYGASEFSLVALTRPGQWRPGVVGHVLDDVTLRITEDGELHAWTPVLMRGYHEAPELTRAAFTEDGFYRTGDRVEITEGGELRYLGRVVDSFNLFDGSHVAPGPIEEAMAKLPWIEQVMLLGDQRPYLTGLVVPHAALRGEVAPALRRLIERDLGRICAEWAPNARVRRVAVLDRALPEEVYQVVGHGKVRRLRGPAGKLLAGTVDALYGGAALPGAALPGVTLPGVTLIDVPGAAIERRGSSRQRRSWLVRIRIAGAGGGAGAGEAVLAYTRDVGRGGAFVEHDEALGQGAMANGAMAIGAMAIEVLDLDGRSLALEAELVRRTPSGSAVRWLGPASALAELAGRLPP